MFGGGGAERRRARSRTAARSVGRASKERADVAHAEADARAVREQIATLNAEIEAEIAELEAEYDPGAIQIDTVPIKPRKSDITIDELALVWPA